MKRSKIIFAVLILSMIALIFSGCGGGGNPVTPPTESEEETIIPDTTKIIDEETKEQVVDVTPDQSVITFAQSTPQLEELQVGDIIIMGVTDQTPYGLLRKVTGINKGTTKYSPVYFYLGFGTLEEAIQKGQWKYSQILKPEDIEKGFVFSEGIQPAREKVSTTLDFGYDINEILYDQDNDPATTENNITATGYIAFDYKVTFDGEIDGHTLEHFIFENIIETESELNISVGVSVSIADLADVADVTIGTIPFTPVTVYIPTPIPPIVIPLVFYPSIELKVGIEGKATIKLEVGITQTTKYTAGIEFTNGDWQNITDSLPKIVNTLKLADPEGTIHVTAHVGPQLNCKLYNAAGPYCNIFGYLDFDADISSDPWWDLDAILAVTAGVKMDLLSIHWDSGERPLFDPLLRFDIAKADGPFGGGTYHSPVISDLTADPSSIDINQTTSITCIASDEDVGDTLTYTWTKTGGTITGSGSTITWTAPSTTGTYTITCTVSDGEGGEDSDSIDIIVSDPFNRLPAPTLYDPGVSVNSNTNYELSWSDESSTYGATEYYIHEDTTPTFDSGNFKWYSTNSTSKWFNKDVDSDTIYYYSVFYWSDTHDRLSEHSNTVDIIVKKVNGGSVHNLSKNTYYDTIQAALDDADSDNTIEVGDGTYDESISFPAGKKIILQSVNGASSTTIRGNANTTTIYLYESPEGTTLEGFTITHESGNSGRGIGISHSNVIINNCNILGNSNTNYGGGVNIGYDCIITINDSIISDNRATCSGGIYNNPHSNVTINRCNISNNKAVFLGGGIENAGVMNIVDSTISGNSANNGAGIFIGSSMSGAEETLIITGSTISDNVADIGGGGISAVGIIMITDCTISGNSAVNRGGGVYFYDSYWRSDDTLTITGCNIINNEAGNSGAGIGLRIYDDQLPIIIGGNSSGDLNNFNTFTDNYKTGYAPSPDQHIWDYDTGDCHTDYPYNYFTPDY